MRNQLVYVFADQTPELVHDLAFSPRFYWRVPGVGDLPAGRTGTRPHVRRMGTMCRQHAATVDTQIEGCTLAIQSSGEAPERLVQALMARAIAFMTKGDYDRAIQDYDQVLSLDPKNGLAFNNRGFAYWRIGDFDRAIGDYENSIGLNPDAALPLFN